MREKIIKHVVLTGGPCAGKSRALDMIQSEIPKLGWTVLVVHETATELITGGVTPWTCSSNFQYHIYQMSLQQYKESIMHRAALDLQSDAVLIVYDRGQLDARSYITDDEFAQICDILSTSEDEMLKRYDAVFYLESVAKGHPELYVTVDNAARHESVEEASIQDTRTWQVWQHHPHVYCVQSYTDFDFKMQVLQAKLQAFLRKFH